MPRRMGRPGLVGTAARTAVVVGTASAVSGSVQRKQAANADAQQQAAAQAAQPQVTAAPEAPAEDDQYEQLKKLADLNAQGVLTDEEFAAAKAKVLGL